MSNNVSSSLHSTGSKELRALLSQLREPTIKTLAQLVKNMLNGADDFLFDLAQKATNNLVQSNYFDTMRLLRMQRSGVEKNFARALEKHIAWNEEAKSFSQKVQALSTQADLEQNFQLLDTEEMEKMVAISAMAKKAEDKFQQEIAHLETRLEWLGYKYGANLPKNMFSPEKFGMAFSEAMDFIDLPVESKLILYKLFDQKVLSQLEELYNNLNKRLIDSGILPKIKLSPKIKQEEAEKKKKEKGEGKDGKGGGHTPTKPLAEELAEATDIDKALAILAAHRPVQPAPGYAAPTELSQGLTQVQLNMPQTVPDEVDPALAVQTKDMVIKQVEQTAKAQDHKVDDYDRKMIDVVSNMFEYIFKDHQISDSVKALISRLQIPYIKIALIDEDFFQDESHPARIFLNQISKAGVGLSSKDDPLFDKFSEIIEVVLTNFSDNIRIFDFALQELERVNWEEQEQVETAEQELEEEAKRDAQKVLARKVVLYELKKQLDGRTLPEFLHPLILKGWSPLMMYRYAQFGRKSPEWKECVDLLSAILTCVFIKKDDSEDLQKLIRVPQNLPEILLQSLLEAGNEKPEMEKYLKPFNKLFMELEQAWAPLREELGDLPAEEIAPAVYDEKAFEKLEQEAQKVEENVLRSGSEKLSILPEAVKPGAWFEIYTGDDSVKRRLKLSTIIQESATLIFTNRNGQRILDKNAVEFSKELEEGKSSLISDSNLFENALLSVISSMKKT